VTITASEATTASITRGPTFPSARRARGAGYVRMGAAASGFAGVATTAPGASLAVVVMRTK
jgi:hypothetical protein